MHNLFHIAFKYDFRISVFLFKNFSQARVNKFPTATAVPGTGLGGGGEGMASSDLRADVDCLEAEVTLLRSENKALRDRRRTLEQRIQTVGTIVFHPPPLRAPPIIPTFPPSPTFRSALTSLIEKDF